MVAVAFSAAQARPASSEDGVSSASGFLTFKFPVQQPACNGGGLNTQPSFAYDRNDCGFVTFALAGNATTAGITARLYDPVSGAPFATLPVTFRAPPQDGRYQFNISPNATWPAGVIEYEIFVPGETGPAGGAFFRHNFLGATVAVTPKAGGVPYAPGEPLPVTGRVFQLNSVPDSQTSVAASFKLRVVTPSGDVRGPYGPFVANQGGAGQFSRTIPGEATAGLTETSDLRVEVVDTDYVDPAPLGSTGRWASKAAGSTGVHISVPTDTLVLENSFASAAGWVKPGAAYPFRIFVKSFRAAAAQNARVTVAPADGMVFTSDLSPNAGTAALDGSGNIVWTIPTVPGAPPDGATILTLVAVAEADTTAEDPEVVWKDLSTRATLTYDGGPAAGVTATSHGPKVIPPGEAHETARFGDRPFPVVPVDFFDRKHTADHTGEALANKINSPAIPGSTFNLYQEMSFGQLFPNGTVPSANFATADWNVQWSSERYQESDFAFTTPLPGGACTGTSYAPARGTPVYQERIHDGWYQMPGDTGYYGSDRSTIGGALALGASEIDNACGPLSKAVYDAAHIADPEIDYSDYDTDKDGVVDFFMMVFPGVGGNGESQTQIPPYDNIWPHSFTLEAQYEDEETGLAGYISDDQLKNLKGQPLYFTNDSRTTMTTAVTDFPVPVRVGPYNVNPEGAIDAASVISHEYGHSLGLPDFYSGPPAGDRATYGDWSLMATDKSHHMDVFAKQEMGWIVPRELPPGTTTVTNWRDSKADTNRIDWRRPDGTPYTLTGPNVHNAQAYKASLPTEPIIDPAKIAAGASPDHVWWSANGNDFGCPPESSSHSFDIFLPELATVPAGSTVTLRFKSYWDIEWDFDYGFVLLTTDDGRNYRSLPSARGYSTPAALNPNRIACQTRHGNGLTGTSASYAAGTSASDRLPVNNVYADGGFLEDEYDLSSAAGSVAAVRFAYNTDGGFVRPGWFIDDVQVLVNGEPIYESDFENGPTEPHVFNGGCNEDGVATGPCTVGWRYLNSSEPSPADHAYYLEMRDRSGFDVDGKGENDRDPIAFQPGLYMMFTDEQHGYGNYATPDPPAQTPLDSQPQPGNRLPNLNDAAWTEVLGDNSFSDSGAGHTDNYTDPNSADGLWHFQHDCLSFDVLAMSGRGIGPLTVPGDLTGDVQFEMGTGCVYSSNENAPRGPTAVIQTRPEDATIREGEDLTFDGSGSRDDLTPPNELRYEWDFENDGLWDAMGQVVVHRYTVSGNYVASLRVTDGDGLTDVVQVPVTVNPFCETTTFTEDVEPSAAAGWQVDTAENVLPTSAPWQQQVDVGAHSPTHSWVSDASSLDLKDDRLVAPAQDLSPTSRLTFWHRYNFESGFDGGVLEASTDGGATWRDVVEAGGQFLEGGYNDTISSEFGSPIGGRNAWTGGPLGAVAAPMEQVVVNVGALAGEGVLFRWRLVTDTFGVGAVPGESWWIDDVEVTGIPQPCNRPPLANDDSASTIEDTPVTIDVLANDSDPEGQALDVTSITQPSNGTAVLNADNTVTYTAEAGFLSPPDDTFTYTASDGENPVTARVSVTVNEQPNQAPTAANDSAETIQEEPVTISVLANDSDPDGDQLVVESTTDPVHGSAGHDGTTVTYTPDPGFVGTDTFDYTAADGNGGAATATVTVTVNPRPNRAPAATDDDATTQEDTAVRVVVLANDSDPDGDPLSVTGLTSPADGTATENDDNSVTYTPEAGFVGTDSFEYTIADGRGGTDTATVTVTVTEAPNRAPTAVDDNAQVKKNKSVRVLVLANDSDPDGDSLTVTTAGDPPHGSVAIDRGRTVTYRPDQGFVGTDTFTYQISDGKGGVATARVTVVVRHDNGN